MTATDVITGRQPWSVEVGDNLDWLYSLPTDCCSLAVTSPPYEAARTYGVGFALKRQKWVDWMVPRVVEMCRVTRGLVCVNMAGQVRDSCYSPVVEWLVADLTRLHGLVVGPAPYCYFRYGVPGSGSMRYHRRDWEPVYCFARPDVLPLAWSDNTALGHAPRWAPGGEMSNRLSDGSRVNQWGKPGAKTRCGSKVAGNKATSLPGYRPSHKMRTKKAFDHAANGTTKGDHDRLLDTAIANPGTVIREQYDAEQVRQLLMGGEIGGKVVPGSPAGDVIRCLVGGNVMGRSKLAHKSEAPFSEVLVEYLVRSYAPPDSVVLEPHAGSGTTVAVTVRCGRRAIGCDLRESQAEITRQRMREELGMFDGVG